MLAVVGCVTQQVDEDKPVEQQVAEEEPVGEKEPGRYPLTITDIDGNEVTIYEPVDGIILLHPASARVIRILGKENLIIGITDSIAQEQAFFPEISGGPSIGRWMSPDIEEITRIAAGYNNVIVISSGGERAQELEEKLVGTGITIVRLNLGNADKVLSETEKLGYILNAEDRVQKYLSFVNSIMDPINDILATIPEEDRPTVFTGWSPTPRGAKSPEDVTGWRAVGRGGSVFSLVEMAGGRPITSALPPMSDVSFEWIMAEDPDKAMIWAMWQAGYNTGDPAELIELYEMFINAPGTTPLKAVQNYDVTVVAGDIAVSPHFFVAIAALVESWYPDHFDLCCQEIHQEFIDEFHGVDFCVLTQGAFVYQRKDQS